MYLKDFGGEFKLIEAIARTPKQKEVIKGIGDDCAVLQIGKEKLLISVDTIVENDHFSFAYFKPKEIGIKAIESSISDIAAMGGKAKYIFLGLNLRSNLKVRDIKQIYQGIYQTCNQYGIDLIGGDTTHSATTSLSVTVLGTPLSQNICYRSNAKSGDLIKVSGDLGASTAGWRLFNKKINGHSFVKKKHTQPKCRLDIVQNLIPHCHAMQDISDGLAAELQHICQASKVSAVLWKKQIPIDKRTFQAAESIAEDAYDYALYGGEDFELVYTVSPQHAAKIPGKIVGKIINNQKKSNYAVYIKNNSQEKKLTLITRSGYNHFS